ncbi:Egl nine-like 1 [Hondaea fermentalgiana]|uniref:Egl nine-like 1 n=1 Tax=Hondaea fermentalgiana TaxID=2315210 RepID=A0A2R5GTY5_9STRA|nr:Egl nine-like 1 [Hondaea fermentalgiana]|eukprot:GBG31851.1 Egl nine-like 1 [Hondaea fermentalgiana]
MGRKSKKAQRRRVAKQTSVAFPNKLPFQASKPVAENATKQATHEPATPLADGAWSTGLRTKYMMLGKAEWWWLFDDALAQIAQRLQRENFVILDGFLDQSMSVELHEELVRAYKAGKLPETRHSMVGCPRMQPGALAGGQAGTSLTYRMNAVRGDHVAWFDGKEEACQWHVLPKYLQRMDTLVSELAALVPNLARTGALRSNAMATCYPGNGAHYVRHCDNTSTIQNGRRLTALFYANPLWTPGHGGELRMFAPQPADLEENERVYVPLADIPPTLGRAVLFFADERCPHEVLPASMMRFAVTVWYFDEEEKLAANKLKNDAARAEADAARTRREMEKFKAKYGEAPEILGQRQEENEVPEVDSDDGEPPSLLHGAATLRNHQISTQRKVQD